MSMTGVKNAGNILPFQIDKLRNLDTKIAAWMQNHCREQRSAAYLYGKQRG